MVAISRRAFVGGAIALGAAGAYLWLSHKLGGGKLVERVAYGNQKLILDKFEKSGLTKVQPYTSSGMSPAQYGLPIMGSASDFLRNDLLPNLHGPLANVLNNLGRGYCNIDLWYVSSGADNPEFEKAKEEHDYLAQHLQRMADTLFQDRVQLRITKKESHIARPAETDSDMQAFYEGLRKESRDDSSIVAITDFRTNKCNIANTKNDIAFAVVPVPISDMCFAPIQKKNQYIPLTVMHELLHTFGMHHNILPYEILSASQDLESDTPQPLAMTGLTIVAADALRTIEMPGFRYNPNEENQNVFVNMRIPASDEEQANIVARQIVQLTRQLGIEQFFGVLPTPMGAASKSSIFYKVNEANQMSILFEVPEGLPQYIQVDTKGRRVNVEFPENADGWTPIEWTELEKRVYNY